MDFSQKYNTEIPPESINAFISWREMMNKNLGRDIMQDSRDYDVQGFFLSGDWKQSENGHMTDKFKKPNHPTFSNESIYHGVDGYEGGEWMQEGEKWKYIPSQSHLNNFGVENLIKYFEQYEPNSELLFK